jgi:tetratricopeptide (TPR) repeat protein
LVRAEDEQKVWSDEVEGDFVALRDLEGKIVAGIANGLNAALVDGGRHAATPEPAALESLLRAKALASKPTSAQMIAEAARRYEAALNDPAIGAEAKAGLAAIHLALALSSGGKPAAFAAHELQECQRLLDEALAAEPKNSSANNTLGALRRATGKPREALAAYEAAVAADRNDANAHAQIGRLMIELGDAEHAFDPIELALRLSPLDAQRPLWFTFVGLARLQIGEAQEARGWLEKAVAAGPHFVTALVFLAAAQQLTGDADGARQTMAAARQMTPALSVARVEQGFAPVDRADPGWLRIRDGLRQAGLPD